MEINLDKKSSTEALIKIKVNESDYQQLVEKKVKDYAKKANIKGFRPGKVPMGMIRKMYGKSILVEEVNQLVSKNLSEYISKNELRVLGNPLLNEELTTPIDWDTQKEFEFNFDLGMVEEFEVKADKSLKVKKHVIKVTEDTINESVKDVRERYGEEKEGEKVEKGDSVIGIVSSEGAGIEGTEVRISLKEAEDSTEKKFLKKKKGDKVNAKLESLFPKGVNEALSLEDAEQKSGKAEVEIKEVKTIEPAEINQELFDKTFGEGKIKSEEEFREEIKKTISQNYDRESTYLLNISIRNALLKNTKIELPENFLKRSLKANEEKITDEVLEKEFDKYAEQLKWDLIKGNLLKDTELKVENVDVKKAAIKKMIGDMPVPDSMAEQLDQMANNYLSQNNGQNYRDVYEELQEEKLFDKLKEDITISEKKVALEDFSKIAEKEMK